MIKRCNLMFFLISLLCGTLLSGFGETITLDYVYDGSGTKTLTLNASDGFYVNSWCAESITVNGTDYTNTYIWFGTCGTYEIVYKSSVAWGHIELKKSGTCSGGGDSTSAPTDGSTSAPTSPPASDPTPAPTNPPGSYPNPPYGQLQVSGGQLRNSGGSEIQLKGMSAHMIQNYPFVKGQTVPNVLSWGGNVIRAAMYTRENGYIDQPATMEQRCRDIVEDALSRGVYVIIDWHILSDGNPNTYKNEAKGFFQKMATDYGRYPHIIYEICNEPNGVGWSEVKSYAEFVIPAIRAIDSDNVIICGTSTWSQDVDQAAANPLSYSNVMYALHFYSGTHGQSLRDKANTAMAQNAAIFISEFGTSEASGTGGPYTAQADEWLSWADSNMLSWCNWSLTTKNETSAALKPDAGMAGPWSDSQLTTSGLWVKGKLGGGGSTSAPTATPASTSAPTDAPASTPVPTDAPTSAPQDQPAGGTCDATATGGNSGAFNTTGAYCFKTQDKISGWGASNFDGRTVSVTVNGTGTAVTNVGATLPSKGSNDYYYFQSSAGNFSWAAIYWW